MPVPATMKAAVYVGQQTVQVDDVPTPQIGAGELLVRVEACGICHTDLKKIEYDLLPGPRIFGHETAGTVVAAGAGVTDFLPWGPRHRVPSYSVSRLLLLSSKVICAVPRLQEGGHHGRVRTGRWWLRTVHPNHGLDRGSRR